MEVIRKSNVLNVLIVIIWYFGGILLGVLGFVRVYIQVVSFGFEKVGILEYYECEEVLFSVEYFDFEKIKWFVLRFNIKIEKIEYL